MERVLRSGWGHVAVTSIDGATARERVRKVVTGIDESAVLLLSALHVARGDSHSSSPCSRDYADVDALLRGLVLPLLDRARSVGKPAFIVIEDADAAGPAALERLRAAVECAPDALGWLRLVLVGDERLERTLQDPAAAVVASRLSDRLRIAREPAAYPVRRTERSPSLDYAALVALCVALAALTALTLAPAPTSREQAYLTSADGFCEAPGPAFADQDSMTEWIDTFRPAPIVAVNPANADSNPVARPDSGSVARPTYESGIATPGNKSDLMESRPDFLVTTGGTAQALRDTPVHEDAAAGAAPDGPSDAVAVDGPTLSDPGPAARVVQSRDGGRISGKPLPGPPANAPVRPTSRSRKGSMAATAQARVVARASSEVMVQAGVFRDAAAAEAARAALARRLQHVVVARLDAANGPVYTVRIVGLRSSREIETAETTLRSLGYDPKRYEEPSAFSRFTRLLQPMWAKLF